MKAVPNARNPTRRQDASYSVDDKIPCAQRAVNEMAYLSYHLAFAKAGRTSRPAFESMANILRIRLSSA